MSQSRLLSKSAAEFFAEHQQIAGFDNSGKSLFTSIRELVENSLDAAESIRVLPDISVSVIEYSQAEHNKKHNIQQSTSNASNPTNSQTVNSTKEKEDTYYLLRVVDNGCGIASENIGNMLGKVLSGSKHGIRQTRGKFGLGSKMALIWAKKSSGLPIHIRSAYSIDPSTPPRKVHEVVLDIDIYKNEPNIISHKQLNNEEEWRGVDISLTIGGNWSSYRSKVLQYFQQLAVITPYANISFSFQCLKDSKKNIDLKFERRSDQMPAITADMLPHPKSLNNITMTNLLKNSTSSTLLKFLTKELNGISPSAAQGIIESTDGLSADTNPASIPSNKIAGLCQVLKEHTAIKPPSASVLSVAGEYNMRLGVMKEMQPKLVATFVDKPSAHEGHPFIVEGAVSIGGPQVREGINVYRFANRIPLLFETGADVVTQVSTKRINWNNYHIDPKKDSVGVFISIVSTKIPFKGTSKEYIGDDILQIQQSVKRVIAGCCLQLKNSLAKNLMLKDEQERKKNLVKYIPDISRSLFGILNVMANEDRIEVDGAMKSRYIEDCRVKLLTESSIASKLQQSVDKFDESIMLQTLQQSMNGKDDGSKNLIPLFLKPINTSTISALDVVIRWKRNTSSNSNNTDILNTDVVQMSEETETKHDSVESEVIDISSPSGGSPSSQLKRKHSSINWTSLGSHWKPKKYISTATMKSKEEESIINNIESGPRWLGVRSESSSLNALILVDTTIYNVMN